MLNTFFDTGQVDASLYTHQPLDFDVGLGWPGLAKILVAAMILVPILLLVLVWLIIRWVKRRRAGQASDCQSAESGGEADSPASRQPGRVEPRDGSQVDLRGRAYACLLCAFLILGWVSGLA